MTWGPERPASLSSSPDWDDRLVAAKNSCPGRGTATTAAVMGTTAVSGVRRCSTGPRWHSVRRTPSCPRRGVGSEWDPRGRGSAAAKIAPMRDCTSRRLSPEQIVATHPEFGLPGYTGCERVDRGYGDTSNIDLRGKVGHGRVTTPEARRGSRGTRSRGPTRRSSGCPPHSIVTKGTMMEGMHLPQSGCGDLARGDRRAGR